MNQGRKCLRYWDFQNLGCAWSVTRTVHLWLCAKGSLAFKEEYPLGTFISFSRKNPTFLNPTLSLQYVTACYMEGGDPRQVGEVTRFGALTCLSI